MIWMILLISVVIILLCHWNMIMCLDMWIELCSLITNLYQKRNRQEYIPPNQQCSSESPTSQCYRHCKHCYHYKVLSFWQRLHFANCTLVFCKQCHKKTDTHLSISPLIPFRPISERSPFSNLLSFDLASLFIPHSEPYGSWRLSPDTLP